ncbi:RQC domain-containing protein, partial [Staphylococcus felis]
ASLKLSEAYQVLIKFLRGEKTDYVKHQNYEYLSTYGIMHDYTTSDLHHLIDDLRFKGFLN